LDSGKPFSSICVPSDKNVESETGIDCAQADSADCAKTAVPSARGFKSNPGAKTLWEKISAFASKFFSMFKTGAKPQCGATEQDNGTTKAFVTTPAASEPAASAPQTTAPAVTTKPTTTAPSMGTPAAEPSDNLSFEKKVAELVNAERAKHGLAPLTLSAELSDIARIKSQDMRDNNYFSHTSPVFGSTFSLLKSHGISYRAAGENIAKGYKTPEAVMDGWMNSPGHRANILSAKYTKIGVGYVAGGNYWTQVFIG
jgi:uncharacterized YkwD family protein